MVRVAPALGGDPGGVVNSRVRFVAVAALIAAMAVGGCEGSSTRRTHAPGARRTSTTSRPRIQSTLPPTTIAPTTLPPTTVTIVTGRVPEGVDGPMPVARVVDGDTIKVSTGITLRLIGLDTPETVDPRKPVQCFGREASSHAHELLDNTNVSLEYDPSQGRLDRYGRTLAYVWMSDGRLYNQLMIADGYAHEYTYSVPYRYQDAFIAAERAARDAQRGLWSPATCAGDTTTPAIGSGGVQTGSSSGCDPSYPGVCIPPPPPDLDCADIRYRSFAVVGADPHRFDGNHDGVGCEG